MKRTLFMFMITLLFYSYLFGQAANNRSFDESLNINILIRENISELDVDFQVFLASKSNNAKLKEINGIAINFEINQTDNLSEEAIKVISTQIEKMFSKTGIPFYDDENKEKLLQQQSQQMEDTYSQDNSFPFGNFEQYNGLLLVKVGNKREYKFGKKILYLTINLELTNIETGKKVWSDSVSNYLQQEYPVYSYFIGLFFLLILAFLINILTQGKRCKVIISFISFLIISYSIWFFFI